jgi:hypothetical protein
MTSTTRMAVLAAVAVAMSACGGGATGGNGGGGSSTAAVIGPGGGTVSTGAVTLTVSPGALSKETQISVSELPSGEGHRRIEIEPRGLALGVPSTLSVRSDDGNSHDERLVEIEHSSSGEIEHSMSGEVENEVEHSREAEIHHTGTFEDRPALACGTPCDVGFECDDGVCKPHGGGSGGGSGGGADDPPGHT